MKRSSVESWLENVGETGCQEPSFKQNTNYDDDDDDDEEEVMSYTNGSTEVITSFLTRVVFWNKCVVLK